MLKLKLQYFGHLEGRTDSLEKILMLGKTEGKRRRGTTEDEMFGWLTTTRGSLYAATKTLSSQN